MADDTNRAYLDAAAFRAAVEALTLSDLIRLRKKAHYFALRTGKEGDELLNDAIVRTLEGERNCPADVPVKTYLENAMRSIAGGEREKFDRESPSGSGHEEDDPIGRFADPAPSPATAALDKIALERVLDRLQEIFANDPQAQAVLIGDMEGWSADEIKEMESMDDKAYATARKRVRRAIEREFPRGIQT